MAQTKERSDWARRLNLDTDQALALAKIATAEDRPVAFVIRRAVLTEIAKNGRKR